ncbi:unnamed protein product [Prunus armeniaca]
MPIGGTHQLLPALTNGESTHVGHVSRQATPTLARYAMWLTTLRPFVQSVITSFPNPTTYVAPQAIATGGKGGGFVREAVTYMITDDMEVKPMSAISSIALFKNFDVRDVRSLEEIVVSLDKDKGLKLLKGIVAVKCSFEECVPLSSISS